MTTRFLFSSLNVNIALVRDVGDTLIVQVMLIICEPANCTYLLRNLRGYPLPLFVDSRISRSTLSWFFFIAPQLSRIEYSFIFWKKTHFTRSLAKARIETQRAMRLTFLLGNKIYIKCSLKMAVVMWIRNGRTRRSTNGPDGSTVMNDSCCAPHEAHKKT